jgi:hypothetical protein
VIPSEAEVVRVHKSELAALNSATKYPSIPTFHVMGDRGVLTEEHSVDPEQEWLLSEKVDGTNARLILMPDGSYLIGSREELLYASGDLVHNPSLGIVDRLVLVAETITKRLPGLILVVYGEVYGGSVGKASKHYTATRAVGFRVFDIALVPVSVLGWEPSVVSAWREHGGQEWCEQFEVERFAKDWNLAVVPQLGEGFVPRSLADVYRWLQKAVSMTRAGLDGADGPCGLAEGVVIRTPDRSAIAKIRFEDYHRTLMKKVVR